jgi:hypothetical protein
MNEDYLHYVWKHRLFNAVDLNADDGQTVEIISPGFHNHHGGPDFSHARIRIGGQIWVGNVEIHVLHSDWDKHGHGSDASYDNIILHVVYEKDVDRLQNVSCFFPTIELKNRLDMDHHWQYNKLLQSGRDFPCQNLIGVLEPSFQKQWIEKQLIARLESKTKDIYQVLNMTNGDWNTVMYRYFSRALGLKQNADPMWWLSGCVPLNIARRYVGDDMRMAALYFGQSGLLYGNNTQPDDYVNGLNHEYEHLSRRHQLASMDPKVWRFLRMRPGSFPTIRIAQLSHYMHHLNHIFDVFYRAESPEDVRRLLDVTLPSYWHNHYILGKPSKGGVTSVGATVANRLIINSIVPVLFAFGHRHGDDALMTKMIDWMYILPPDRNAITIMYANAGLLQFDAATSQGTIHVYQTACVHKRCLQCEVGSKLLSFRPNQYQNVKTSNRS